MWSDFRIGKKTKCCGGTCVFYCSNLSRSHDSYWFRWREIGGTISYEHEAGKKISGYLDTANLDNLDAVDKVKFDKDIFKIIVPYLSGDLILKMINMAEAVGFENGEDSAKKKIRIALGLH